ncbi:MAG: hypothetical protein ABII64_00805 [Elusimicrobiota bacterium]
MKRIAIGLCILAVSFGLIFAAGHLSATGELFLENLRIGRTYHVKDLGKDLFKISNNSDRELELTIEPVLPEKSLLRKGYKSLPSARWIKTDVDKLKLSPGQVGLIDVIISIPREKKYIGKKYQFHIWSKTAPVKGSGVKVATGIESIFRITIAK